MRRYAHGLWDVALLWKYFDDRDSDCIPYMGMDWNCSPDEIDVEMAAAAEMHKAYSWNSVLHWTSSSTERAKGSGTTILLVVEIDETVVAVAVADDDLVEEYDRGSRSMMNTSHCYLLTRIHIEKTAYARRRVEVK